MQRKLYRSRTDSMLAGVCGGLGEYSGIDPTVIRLAFVFLTLFGGHGLLLYLIMCVVVPPEPLPATTAQPVVPPAGPSQQ
jgi:phage shock protein PspC (stress-responsive transcriptional regulator)